MPELTTSLSLLARAYEQHLAEPQLNRRLGHHILHVAPEGWLAHELAWLVNQEGARIGLEGWSAKLERQKVDVMLLPPDKVKPVHLELKLMPPAYWSNWYGVYHDLGHGEGQVRTKPIADYAICFLMDDATCPPNRKPSTHERYQEYIQRVPEMPGTFEPLAKKMPPLHLAAPAPKIIVSWQHPGGQQGINAWIRILWVCNPSQTVVDGTT